MTDKDMIYRPIQVVKIQRPLLESSLIYRQNHLVGSRKSQNILLGRWLLTEQLSIRNLETLTLLMK